MIRTKPNTGMTVHVDILNPALTKPFSFHTELSEKRFYAVLDGLTFMALAHAKVDAIKQARFLFGLNLRDAKNLIESRMRMLEGVDINARLATLRNMEHV
jgi:hypothetical protein